MRTNLLILLTAATAFALPAQAQFSAARELPGDLSIAPAAGEQRHAAIAQGNGQSLIVYEDHRAAIGDTVGYSSTGVAMLSAARLDAAGNVLDPTPISVRKGTGSPRDPRVAWNGSTYLVVWDELVPHTFESDRAVFAARIDTAGHVIDDPPILLVDASYVDESYPVVASDGANWSVVWNDLVNGADAIRGSVIAANGLAGPIKTMMTASIGFYFPVGFEIAWSNGRYLFVSQHLVPGGQFNDAVGQLFGPALDKIGTEFDITFGSSIGDVQVAGNGTDFCVTWRFVNQSIRATPVSANGAVLVQNGIDLMGPTPGYAAYQLPSVAWDGTAWAVAFGTGSGQNTAMNVARLSSSGVLLGGAPIFVSQGSAGMYRPAITSAPGGVRLVWDDERVQPNPIAGFASDRTDLFTSFVTDAGVANSPVDVSLSPPAQLDPQIAGDAMLGYLVAFFSVTQSTATVNVQRLDAAGRPIDAQPTALFTGPRTLHNLALASNGANWMLVWDDFTLSGTNIRGMRVSASGAALDVAPVTIMSGSGPAIAAVGGDYMIVATDEPVLHHRYVYTLRVHGADGSFVDSAPVQRTNAGFDTQTCVAAFNDRWIVAWAHAVTHDAPYASIRSMFVFTTGLASVPDVAGTGLATNSEPTIAVDGAQALLVWTSNGDLLGRRILQDGTKLDTDAGFVISNAANSQIAPSVGWNGIDFVAAFTDYSAQLNPLTIGIGDVYATRVDSSGTVLDPNGNALANAPLVPEGRPSVAGNAGASIVAFTALRTEAPFGNWRIAISADLPPAGTGFCFGDGSGAACPCGNFGAPGHGCANSVSASGANLSGSGFASLAHDSLVLEGVGMPSSSALYFQGTTLVGGGLGAGFGDGLRCAGGSVIRLGTQSNASGGSQYPGVGSTAISVKGQVGAPGTRSYQVWYRNAANYCTTSTSNLSNGLLVAWIP